MQLQLFQLSGLPVQLKQLRCCDTHMRGAGPIARCCSLTVDVFHIRWIKPKRIEEKMKIRKSDSISQAFSINLPLM